jgi:DNA-binding NtrC family response regulator
MDDAAVSTLPGTILVVDDDPELRKALERTLERAGHTVHTASDAERALALVAEQPPDLVVTDLMLPSMDGIELLRKVKELNATTEVLLITAHASVERAVEAMRLGAYDFVEKPIQREKLLRTVVKALEKQSLAAENLRLRAQLEEREGSERLVGTSRRIVEIKRLIAQVASTDVPVLITGESGTGKEVAADMIHALSPRRKGPLVKISCAAIPEHLLESELFGYERGAFSGAIQSKPGRFELANHGTLFLDEIGDMAAQMQAKLLRVLQDGRVQRLGGTRDITVDARLISATNVDIDRAIRERQFREDLYHRLNVIEIHMPPLRERIEDIPLLVAHFLRVFGPRRATPIEGVLPDALDALSRHSWPGNVRELENVMQRALATAPGPVLRAADLSFAASHRFAPAAVPSGASAGGDVIEIPVGMQLSEVEEVVIADALRRAGGDKEKAAHLLGISSRTLYRRAKESRESNGGEGK